MAKIIAIANQKGGVGKTTTAVNLSASLAVMEKNVLLIDMDPQGNASQGLGIVEEQEEDVYEALELAENSENVTKERINEIILGTSIEFLDLISCSTGLAGMELELVNAENRNHRLKKVVEAVEEDYDYIIIDSPPSLGLLTINILCAAKYVVIPVQCEFYAMQGLAELLNTIRSVQKNLNGNLEILGALLTMYDARLSLAKQVAEDIRSCFADKVFKAVIPRNVKLGEAPSHGKPVILYDVMCQGAKAYISFAEELHAMGESNG